MKSRVVLFNLIDDKNYSDDVVQVLGAIPERSVPYLKLLSVPGRKTQEKAQEVLKLISYETENIELIN